MISYTTYTLLGVDRIAFTKEEILRMINTLDGEDDNLAFFLEHLLKLLDEHK